MTALVRPFDRRDISTLAAEVVSGRLSGETLAREALRRIDEVDDRLKAFLSRDPEAPLVGRETDRRVRASGDPAPLAGVPIAVKDNLCTLGLPTTCGSRLLEGYRSPYEATAVRRLRDAGATIIGKTNLDEFAMGSSTENSAFGASRNPHDPHRVPGGSSGGSAAAVAAGVVPGALGSDTGGSVRQPAAFCGVVGIKPTWGRVSRYGLVAFASSLDQVGTLGTRMSDAALLLRVVSGPDPRDATASGLAAPELTAALDGDVRGLVVGVPTEYFPPELDPGVAQACRGALEAFRIAGATVREISLPHTRWAIPTYYVLAPAEASSNLARYDGVRFGRRDPAARSTLDVYVGSRSRGLGEEVKRRILLGTFALSAGYQDRYYGRAQRVRALIAEDFRRAFAGGVDVVFTPTTPAPAFPLGERTGDPFRMYLADVFTVTANLAGLPAASLPIGMSGGLPVGGQLLAPLWGEETLVRAGAALERELDAGGAWTWKR